MSLSCRFSKNLPVSGREVIVGQGISGPKEMNIFIKSRERCQLNSVVVPVNGAASVCRGRISPGSSAVRNVGEERTFPLPRPVGSIVSHFAPLAQSHMINK